MIWIALYLIVATAVAGMAFLAGEWLRTPGVPAPDRPGAVAAAAGLLWPLLAAGLVELGVFAVVRSRLRSRHPEVAAHRVRILDPVAH